MTENPTNPGDSAPAVGRLWGTRVSYLNQLIRRTKPASRCQCAVLGVLTEEWASVDAIWKRGPVYCDNRHGRVRLVAYGTICAAIRGLVQQGYAEVRGGKRKQYRQAA